MSDDNELIAEVTPATAEQVHAWLAAEQKARMHDWQRYNVLLTAARAAASSQDTTLLYGVLVQLRDPRWAPPNEPNELINEMSSPPTNPTNPHGPLFEELAALARQLPENLKADWKNTNHYELTTDAEGRAGYWWLAPFDIVNPHENDTQATIPGQRLGLLLDIASTLSKLKDAGYFDTVNNKHAGTGNSNCSLAGPNVKLELTELEQAEYNRCLDSLMRQTHSFEPSEDQKARAWRLATSLPDLPTLGAKFRREFLEKAGLKWDEVSKCDPQEMAAFCFLVGAGLTWEQARMAGNIDIGHEPTKPIT